MTGSSVGPHNATQPADRSYKLAWLATLLFFISYYVLLVPLPRYLAQIDLPDWQIGLILGATGIASLIMRPFSGVLTDRYGARRIMLFGAACLIGGALLVIWTRDPWLLFGLRMLQATGYVVFTTAGNTLVSLLSTPENRSQRVAYFGLAANFAMTMTPGATSLAINQIGLLPAFGLSGLMGLLAGGLASTLRVDHLASKASANAATNHVRPVWQFPSILRTSMAAAALLGAGFGAYFQYFAVLIDRRAITPVAAPFAVYGISIIITRLAFGSRLDRIGFGRVLGLATVLMTIGCLVAAAANDVVAVSLAAALIAAGGGLFHPTLIAHHVLLHPHEQGVAIACFYFGFDLGIGAGAWILGAVLDWWGLGALFTVAAIFSAATVLLIPAISRQRKVMIGA